MLQRLSSQAGLSVQAPSGAGRGWLPISLYALIEAIFARILGRLEHLLLLWQTGLLPAPRCHDAERRLPVATRSAEARPIRARRTSSGCLTARRRALSPESPRRTRPRTGTPPLASHAPRRPAGARNRAREHDRCRRARQKPALGGRGNCSYIVTV